MTGVYIALGSNIEPRQHHLKEALALLDMQEHIAVIKKSSIYETAPVGYTDQADFLNMVIQLETSLSPTALLDVCHSIEHQRGRKRDIRFGPRTIDLDILLYDNENRKTQALTIPHPRMHERAFVLIPLAEIAPEVYIADLGKNVLDMVHDLPQQDEKDVTRWTPNE